MWILITLCPHAPDVDLNLCFEYTCVDIMIASSYAFDMHPHGVHLVLTTFPTAQFMLCLELDVTHAAPLKLCGM